MALSCHRSAQGRPATARRSGAQPRPVVLAASAAVPAAPASAVPASKLIDGKGIADTIRQEIAAEVAVSTQTARCVPSTFRQQLPHPRMPRPPLAHFPSTTAIRYHLQAMKSSTGLTPGLAVVLVGARKDSETYVRSKKKACAEVRAG